MIDFTYEATLKFAVPEPPPGTVRVRWYVDGRYRYSDGRAPFNYNLKMYTFPIPSTVAVTAKCVDANGVVLAERTYMAEHEIS